MAMVSQRRRRTILFVAVILPAAVLSGIYGCSLRKAMIGELTAVIDQGATAYEQDDDLDLIERSFPANIKLLEALLVNDPQNQRLLVLLSRFYGSYAFLFSEGRIEAEVLAQRKTGIRSASWSDLTQSAVSYYRKGFGYALQALENRHPGAEQQLANVATAAPFVQSLAAEDGPALFWYGFNLSGLVNHSRTNLAVVAKAHLIEKSMRRVLELDPSIYYGSAHLVLIAYYGSRSPAMGGDPQRALNHCQELKALQGEDFLLVNLFYARYYLVQTRRKNLFEQVLADVVENQGRYQAYPLFNRIAVDRAKLYLENSDSFFE